jgi:hypothetical protein
MGTAIEVDDEQNAVIEAALEKIRDVEKNIALADYELRNVLSFRVANDAVKEQTKRFEPLYAHRDTVVDSIPRFWLRVVCRWTQERSN